MNNHSLVDACDNAVAEISKTHEVLNGKYLITNHKKNDTTRVVITLIVKPKRKPDESAESRSGQVVGRSTAQE